MRVPNDLDLNDPLVLDRLVDGELTDAEERALIAQLSQAPDGWRRCALAFLEARCWQQAALSEQALPHPEHATDGKPRLSERRVSDGGADSKQGLSFHWAGALALGAVFLLAFGGGALLPRPWKALAPRSPGPSVATVQRDSDAQSQPHAPNDSVAQDPPINSQDLLLGNLKLVDHSGRTFDVPVYDWNRQVVEQLMYPSQPLSSEFFQQLKRHQVRRHQSYVPVKLQDGRRVVLPVQEVEIVPVGRTAY